ncbi:MAG: helix-turn-helix domain-containing protein [Pseudonocardia sp.]
MNPPSRSASRARLGRELRKYRTDAGLLIEDAAKALDCSLSNVSRLETGKGIPRHRDVRDLLDLYKIFDEKTRQKVLELAADGQGDEWWADYRDVVRSDMFADHLLRYVELEQEALSLRWFESEIFPGLFQSETYIGAVADWFFPAHTDEERERFVAFRLRRQEILRTATGRTYEVVLSEAALLRPVGNAHVMRVQAEWLHEALQKDLAHVEFRILPVTVPSAAAIGGPFIVMRFAEEHGDCVYFEGRENAEYLSGEDTLEEYDRKFELMLTDTLDRSESVERLARAAEDWHRAETGP